MDANLHINASLYSESPRHYMHQRRQPLSSSPFEPVGLQAFPTVESFRTFPVQFLIPLSPPLPEGGEVGHWSGSWDRCTIPRTPGAAAAAAPVPDEVRHIVDTLDPPRSVLVPPPLVSPAVNLAPLPPHPRPLEPALSRWLPDAAYFFSTQF